MTTRIASQTLSLLALLLCAGSAGCAADPVEEERNVVEAAQTAPSFEVVSTTYNVAYTQPYVTIRLKKDRDAERADFSFTLNAGYANGATADGWCFGHVAKGSSTVLLPACTISPWQPANGPSPRITSLTLQQNGQGVVQRLL